MDMPEVKAFNAELSGLYDNKPPISKAKMSAITRGAIKAIKFYKHVVHSVEKFIQKCKPEYKVPGLYVIDSIVRQSRHQFGQDKDVFAPRFAKNMQQTFANLFRCPPENKGNIIRVLNLWQKNNVFGPEVIQPLMDMADPNHPLHQEIQQQQNNTANGSSLSLNTSHNTDKKISPVPAPLHTPPDNSPMGDSFQDQPSGNPGVKFNRKLLNDFEYESEDEGAHESHATHTSHATHSSHSQPQQTAETLPLGSILTNPEIMRQLQSLQAQMQLMTGMQIPNLMPMMSDMQLQQNQNQNLPFSNKEQKQNESKDDMVESDIEFVETGPQVIEIPDANDSRSPSPRRRHRSRSRSPRRRRRSSRSRSRSSRSPRRRREKDRERDRDRDRDRNKERDNKSHKEREADKEKQREREKKGLPPIKKENLSVCSTTLWVGHLSKLATQEELSDLFGAVGGVVSIDVVAPRGCAFVVMERRRDAHKALTTLNKHKLHSKEIAVAWAPGKGVKGREWKDYWESELGVSYLPWNALHARWALGALSLDALEDGGAVDEDTLPPWLPPRILPKSMLDGMVSMGMMGMGGAGAMPPMPNAMPGTMPGAMPTAMPNMPALQLPPPGMAPGLPPGMPPGMPPGLRPPAMPAQVPGLQPETGMPPTSALLRFPGMPPQPIQSMAQPGMPALPGFLGGLLAVGGLVGGVPLHAPHQAPPHHALQQQRVSEVTRTDDAMDLDTEDNHTEEAPSDQPPQLSDQLQALLSKPPPGFNSSEPPPPFNLSEPPPAAPAPAPAADEKPDDKRDRRDRDRDRRDRGDRDRRDRDRGNRDRDRGNRDRERGDRDRDRDRDRGGRDRGGRDRDRDRDRDNRGDRFNAPRDNNNRESSRSKSPSQGEKSLQERLWEMANGKRDECPQPQDNGAEDNRVDRPPIDRMSRPSMDGDDAAGGEWQRHHPGGMPHGPPPFRPGPWMEGAPGGGLGGPGGTGPPGPPFGPRFNGAGPGGPPPFPRPPFDGPPRFERPPFNRMPFDGPNRPPFDGPRPPFDGPRPPFDGPRPPFDGPRPLFDGPRPPFDGPRPFDGPFDGERPFDGPPRFDGPPEFFDRNNRRFGPDREDREFNDRGWNGDRDRERGDRDWGDRRNDWNDDRRRDRFRDRSQEDRFPDRNRNDRRRNFDDRNERDRPERDRGDRSDRNDKGDKSEKSQDRDRQERPKREDRPSRQDRQKDRKSRWGAAEEPAPEEKEAKQAEAAITIEKAEGDSNKEQSEPKDVPSQDQGKETERKDREPEAMEQDTRERDELAMEQDTRERDELAMEQDTRKRDEPSMEQDTRKRDEPAVAMETETSVEPPVEREPVESEPQIERPNQDLFDDNSVPESTNQSEERAYEDAPTQEFEETPNFDPETVETSEPAEKHETSDLYDDNDAVDTSFSIPVETVEKEQPRTDVETEQESKSEDIFEQPSKEAVETP